MSSPIPALNVRCSHMTLDILIMENMPPEFKDAYINAIENHNKKLEKDGFMMDAGFDILVPPSNFITRSMASNTTTKMPFGIKCRAFMHHLNSGDDINSHPTGFYMYPRSSLSKTKLRLANSVGIIDAGYRGELLGAFDCNGPTHLCVPYDRLVQICSPNLSPIYVRLVNSLGEETTRGEGGFGSTS